MTEHSLDSFDHQQQTQRLFQQFEALITAFNTANISEATGGVSARQFLQVARAVSLLRARYLKEVLALAGIEAADDQALERLREIRGYREAYQEALEGFGALRHALIRKYFKLAEDGEEISLTS